MITILSPAKKINLSETEEKTAHFGSIKKTQPDLSKQTEQLIEITRNLSKSEIRSLMRLSDTLADLNYHRFQGFSKTPSEQETRQAIFAFAGDVYQGLKAHTLTETDLNWAQNHIRILSGLYGVLRPLDGIQAYRLEMGTRLQTLKGHTLYEFWGGDITENLNQDIQASKSNFILNLSSQEYMKAIKPDLLACPIVHCHFYEIKQGKARPVMLYTKRARGLMARWVIDHKVNDPEGLKEFNFAGYRYNEKASQEKSFVFERPHPKA